jgi:hypothetical protein
MVSLVHRRNDCRNSHHHVDQSCNVLPVNSARALRSERGPLQMPDRPAWRIEWHTRTIERIKDWIKPILSVPFQICHTVFHASIKIHASAVLKAITVFAIAIFLLLAGGENIGIPVRQNILHLLTKWRFSVYGSYLHEPSTPHPQSRIVYERRTLIFDIPQHNEQTTQPHCFRQSDNYSWSPVDHLPAVYSIDNSPLLDPRLCFQWAFGLFLLGNRWEQRFGRNWRVLYRKKKQRTTKRRYKKLVGHECIEQEGAIVTREGQGQQATDEVQLEEILEVWREPDFQGSIFHDKMDRRRTMASSVQQAKKARKGLTLVNPPKATKPWKRRRFRDSEFLDWD